MYDIRAHLIDLSSFCAIKTCHKYNWILDAGNMKMIQRKMGHNELNLNEDWYTTMNGKCYQHSSSRAWQKSATQWTVSPHVNSTLTGCRKQIKIKYYVEFITQLNGIGQWTTKDDDRIEIVIIRKMKLKENVSFFPIRINGTMTTEKYIKFMSQFRGKSCAKRKTYQKQLVLLLSCMSWIVPEILRPEISEILA